MTRLTIDNSKGGVAPPSALAQTSAQTAFAFKNLAATYPSICMSARVNVAALDPSVDDPVPAADGGKRPDREGLRQRQRDPVRQIRRREHPDLLGRRPRQRMAHHRAVRHGRDLGDVGPVPGWRQDRERLDRQHRDDAGRQGGDRERAGRHGDDQLRRRRRRSGAGLGNRWGRIRWIRPHAWAASATVQPCFPRQQRDRQEPTAARCPAEHRRALLSYLKGFTPTNRGWALYASTM